MTVPVAHVAENDQCVVAPKRWEGAGVVELRGDTGILRTFTSSVTVAGSHDQVVTEH